MEQKKEKKNKKAKFILIGLGVVAIGGAAYYFYNKKPKDKGSFSDELIQRTSPPLLPDPLPTTRKAKGTSAFPLKRGSRGDLVRQLQIALIKNYGADTLPKWGADGQWGGELTSALIANGHPTQISSALFTKLISKSGGGGITTSAKKKGFRPKLIADNLRLSILDNDFSKALRVIERVKNVARYSSVSSEFKKKRIYGVRKSIVNALLTKFWEKKQKKQLNAEFHRIGLKFNGSQWSLSGVPNEEQLKTILPTFIWKNTGEKLPVPKDTIIGNFEDAKNGVTAFRTIDGKQLFVLTKHISYS